MKGPVYIVKPKNIFRHPFNKFDLDKPMNRDSQNEDLTDYFNYGFNQDTMNIYGKLVKRTIEVLDEGINPTYFDAASELMRLNDQIPMDFGGFCKFFDTSIFVNPDGDEQELEYMIDYHNGQRLFNFFIYIASSKNPNASEYPLIDFVRCMYKNFLPEEVEMCDVMDQIEQNLEKRYQETMKKLRDKKNNPGGNPTAHDRDKDKTETVKKEAENDADIMKSLARNTVKQEEKTKKQQSEDQSSSQSDSSSEDSSQSSESKRKRKTKRSGRSRSREKSRKDKKDKSKRKVSKEKDRKGKDRKDKDRKEKSRRRSRSRDNSRRKDKSSKKRRN